MSENDWFYSNMFDAAIYSKDGQSFEDFFCDIMKSSDDNFQKIKASGRIGDRNCDGLNKKLGVFYLCYAPEDIKKVITTKNALAKIQNDVNGILSKWNSIKKIAYVINDKFSGLSPTIIDLFHNLQSANQSMIIEIFSMESLRKICLSLTESDKQRILGYCPDLSKTKACVDFDTISKITNFLETNSSLNSYADNYVVPDFSQKINYNRLSKRIEDLLNNAKYYIHKIDEFFNLNPSYNKEDLRNYLRTIYLDGCSTITFNNNEDYHDGVFFYMIQKIAYNPNSKAVMENVIIILAFFFESCDIFEEPLE